MGGVSCVERDWLVTGFFLPCAPRHAPRAKIRQPDAKSHRGTSKNKSHAKPLGNQSIPPKREHDDEKNTRYQSYKSKFSERHVLILSDRSCKSHRGSLPAAGLGRATIRAPIPELACRAAWADAEAKRLDAANGGRVECRQ